jgi:hypothetical protein
VAVGGCCVWLSLENFMYLLRRGSK